jgi:hypothetical protein
VNEARFNRLDAVGLIARTVRHKKGHINRAILCGSRIHWPAGSLRHRGVPHLRTARNWKDHELNPADPPGG